MVAPTRSALVLDRARAAAAYEAAHAPSTPAPPRTSSYVTYSSWAPATDYRTTYIPTYLSYVRQSAYYHGEYTTKYVRPQSLYERTFDNQVKIGPFGQRSYATDRLRTRSRSRERVGKYSYAGYVTPPPLRMNQEYKMPSRYAQATGSPNSAPLRSGSFVNFMDYIITTDNKLRRSASRSDSGIGEETLSKSVSKTLFPTPADQVNRWYDQKVSHVNNYVNRLSRVYDQTVYGYYSRYNTSRPFTGYAISGLGDYSFHSRSMRGHAFDLERRLHTHKTYLSAYGLTRLPTMTRSIFY